MLTNGLYFEKYLKQPSFNQSERKNNDRLLIIIKKLGNSVRFEQFILELRRNHSIPESGYLRDPQDDDRLLGYNYSAEIERVADDLNKQFEKWRVPRDLRYILSGFLLCNEPLYFDTRATKGTLELNDYSATIKLDLPVNSSIELKRYIDLVYPLIDDHQSKKGYKKFKKRSLAKKNIERDSRVIEVHEKLKKVSRKGKIRSDMLSNIEKDLEENHGDKVKNGTLRNIIYRTKKM